MWKISVSLTLSNHRRIALCPPIQAVRRMEDSRKYPYLNRLSSLNSAVCGVRLLYSIFPKHIRCIISPSARLLGYRTLPYFLFKVGQPL